VTVKYETKITLLEKLEYNTFKDIRVAADTYIVCTHNNNYTHA